MTVEQYHVYLEQTFDSFCKTVVRNKYLDILDEYAQKVSREQSIDAMSDRELSAFYVEDQYRPYCKVFSVKGIDIKVYDHTLAELLQYIPQDRRAVILLCFFLDLNDMEIGQILHIKSNTVKYRRNAALKRLRELLEGIDYA